MANEPKRYMTYEEYLVKIRQGMHCPKCHTSFKVKS
jgi:hypothetical protein